MKAEFKIDLSSNKTSACGRTPMQIFRAVKASLIKTYGADAVEQTVKENDRFTYLTVA